MKTKKTVAVLFSLIILLVCVGCGEKFDANFTDGETSPYFLDITDSTITISYGKFNIVNRLNLAPNMTIHNCNFRIIVPDTVVVEKSEIIQGAKVLFANVDTIYVLNYETTIIKRWGQSN